MSLFYGGRVRWYHRTWFYALLIRPRWRRLERSGWIMMGSTEDDQ